MQLVIKNGFVVASHSDTQDIAGKYPECEVIFYCGEFTLTTDGTLTPDPRTEDERLDTYKSQRRLAFPSINDQLDMQYWDSVNGTTIWRDMIEDVKNRFPKTPKDE
jgi:hypothetical protein